jgi:putative Mg2+ transporter-C (MgtC) family protein
MNPEVEVLLRVALAAVLGAVVGYDRERQDKPAGLRTHMLVSAGSALFVGSAALIVLESQGTDSNLDVLRVTAAIATGIGFLGAGAIIRLGSEVVGLTTAAGIWVTAGIGVAVGLGQYWLSVGATLVAVLVIAIIGGRFVPEPGSGPEQRDS